jgi:putative ABC transport system permease protein
MIRLYLLHALYTLRRHPAYALLNVLTLSLALGCCLLLYWYVSYHLSFDRYHKKGQCIVRLMTEVHAKDTTYSEGIATPVGPALRRDMPWLSEVAMYIWQPKRIVRVVEPDGRLGAKFAEERIMAYVEPAYFRILDYRWLVGSPDSCLQKPFSAVLTNRLARQYFGSKNPIGRCLRLGRSLEVRITGLIDSLPPNTDQDQELFVSYATLNHYLHNGTGLNQWEGVSSYTQCWVLLPKTGDLDRLRRELPHFQQKNAPETAGRYHYQAVLLSDVHTAENYTPAISQKTIRVLVGIGILLLITACLNFINMATAQATRRGREIGVRRVIGGTRRRIFWQFMVETAVLVTLAAGVGIVLGYSLLPWLRQWTNTPIPFGMDGQGWVFLLGLIGVMTFLSGTYPGLILAGFRPAQVLKEQSGRQLVGGLPLRRLLVMGQLAICQGFVVAVLVMNAQLTAWLRSDLGFETSQRITIPLHNAWEVNLNKFRSDLINIPGIEGISLNFSTPNIDEYNTSYVRYGQRSHYEPFQMEVLQVDSAYLNTFKIPLLTGKNLPGSDTTQGILLNETAVKMLGLGSPDEAIGQKMTISDVKPFSQPVIGVVCDWRSDGNKAPSTPTVLLANRNNYRMCTLVIDPVKEKEALQAVKIVWDRYFPNAVYAETRLTEQLGVFYEREQAQLRFVQLAAGVAILIGCVGLFGLITFLTGQRKREIAIRKAVGASEGALVWLFLREFLGLLMLAFLVASPVVWWLMGQWLQPFDNHLTLTYHYFLASLGLIAFIVMLTIALRTYRAALENPAPSLRAD